nr:hypothetical protein CFP56_61893 [Quercus suber]
MPFPVSFSIGKILKKYVETQWTTTCAAPIKRRPLGRPKKKRALEPDEPRSHRKNKVLGISKQCKAAKDGHVNNPTVGSAQPSSNAQPTINRAQLSSTDDVTTTAPPPPLITSPVQDQKDRGREVQSPLRP